MYQGIPTQGLAFLRGLAKNNDREWFQPRKEIFETQLKAPMEQLVEAVNAELLKFAPEHITDPKKALYRIYRDTRFSNDKTPYKNHIAANFPRRNVVKHASAGYYFHIAAKQIGIAAGVWMPGPDELFAIRTWLTEHHAAFLKAAKAAGKTMGALQGSSLARSPKGFAPEHPAAELVRMKQWIFWQEMDVKVATTAQVVPELIKRFRAAAPVVEALNAALGRTRATAARSPL